jgi:hypothetical protein
MHGSDKQGALVTSFTSNYSLSPSLSLYPPFFPPFLFLSLPHSLLQGATGDVQGLGELLLLMHFKGCDQSARGCDYY